MPDDPLAARLRAAGCVFAEAEAAELRSAAARRGWDAAALEEAVARRVAGEPLEPLVGRARFAGVDVDVAPGVFVPRRRSELLVEVAERHLAAAGSPLLLELGCGTAAVTRALLSRVARLRAWAGDVDPAAVRCAAATLAGLPGVLGVGVSDWDAAVPDDLAGRVDVLAAHVPYVPTEALALLPREAREHEPARALDGGDDGLDPLRAVAALAPRWLAPGGLLLAEVAPRQVAAAGRTLLAAGLDAGTVADPDEERGGLVLLGQRPPDRGHPHADVSERTAVGRRDQ